MLMKRTTIRCPASIATLLLSVLLTATESAASRELTFEERVRAQQAIERVYYSHQIGATKPFEAAVPRAALEGMVRTYLKQSIALERLWRTPVTSEMLRNEMERMARQTRMPDRLRELFGALGDDPLLIQETLARPALVSRLVRNFFASDQVIHAAAHLRGQELRQQLLDGTIDPRSERPGRTLMELVRAEAEPGGAPHPDRADSGASGALRSLRLELRPEEFDRWRSRLPEHVGAIGALDEERESFVIRVVLDEAPGRIEVASFEVRKQSWDDWWRGLQHDLDVASARTIAAPGIPLPALTGRHDETLDAQTLASAGPLGAAGLAAPACADDTWDNGSLDDTPAPRRSHSAVWTGSQMVIWGGVGESLLSNGGKYDPATDVWTPTSTTNAPTPRYWHTAIWTGSVMVIWGGYNGTYLNTGGRYDPLSDTWAPTSTVGAPTGRWSHTALWTGAAMVVWGGYDGVRSMNSGGRYEPVTDVWAPTSTTAAPTGRLGHTAVWTGASMIVWGGYDGVGYTNTGNLYDPVGDVWVPTSLTGAPTGRRDHTAVWTGSSMVVWGGSNDLGHFSTGGRYDPSHDSWTPTSISNAPVARASHAATWTGSRMVAWGGFGAQTLNTGGLYDPATDAWTPISTVNTPSPRAFFTAIWTGNLMIVWGGWNGAINFNTGGRYSPADDTWTPTSTGGAPAGRTGHVAVWTGSEMVIWGGRGGSLLSSGGRYDPAMDVWTPTSATNAPPGRTSALAVWTGNVMVVWGGEAGTTQLLSGGRYDPLTDTWLSVNTGNAPNGPFGKGVAGAKAVWTGSLMIVWGGSDSSLPPPIYLNTGARYNPVTDVWTATSTVNAPAGRSGHTAVWSGRWMIIWGGYLGNGVYASTGGRYDPGTDTWLPTSTSNAPSPRYLHSVIWAGDVMVVWGGGLYLNSGGRYDPLNDTWSPTTTMNAPAGRYGHTSVWTGSRMLIWGGLTSSERTNTGGRYDPIGDAWSPTSVAGVPSARVDYTSVWTGDFMIVWGGQSSSLDVYFNTGGRYCACSMQTYYRDTDGDGRGDAGAPTQSCSQPAGYVTDGTDCNDGDAGAWAIPSEVEAVLFPDDVTLTWAAPSRPGAIADLYDAIRSAIPSDFVTNAVCVASDTGPATATDGTTPPLGKAFYYLVRAQDACPGGQGPLGTRSDGTPITGRSCP